MSIEEQSVYLSDNPALVLVRSEASAMNLSSLTSRAPHRASFSSLRVR